MIQQADTTRRIPVGHRIAVSGRKKEILLQERKRGSVGFELLVHYSYHVFHTCM